MAWNEPGNNGQRDPWNRNRPGGKLPLDDLLNNARKRLGKLGQGPGSLLTGVLVLLIVGLLFSSYTIIGARQAGVVLRFGEYSRTLPPGFHLKLPQPIESVTKVEATRIRSVTDKVAMLTKDENIITIDFTVQYQVDDSRKYLFSLNDPDGTIGAAAEAAVRSVIGSSDMDQILSAAGASLVAQAQETLQKTLDTYDSGLRVTEVSFQNVAPPNEVKDAFDDVNNAREDKQSIENAALAYASKVVPVARGDAARIAAEAAGYKAERVARATGDAARFDLLLKQYKAAPEVTRKRLWLETMEQVMAKNPKVIDGSNGRNIINLPTPQGSPAAAQPDAGTTGAVVSPPTGSAAGKGAQP
ncbi:FtsH protease activity modulator HflK [Rhodanobacter denitrificans]|uniref:Protein HflK n=1 Tax=Rhodanobacter denitrificans TaxID=666685 RepID=M4NDB8_9GAMM|nr:FtsH protease activity modulator HflK [Rhodanobacter denitrificans]AGG88704.1 HflK protein [Rhodanobacter denitrificans]UJJ58627.1 FtsH protease activity modulator HflK [Rhodanobacter denitrificans]UJM87839.1 FtsH protease activity modulator HflK [Rhodanobacter denitrificans]